MIVLVCFCRRFVVRDIPPPDNLLERLRFLMTYFPGYHCLNIKILANDIDFASVRIRMRIMVMVRITK